MDKSFLKSINILYVEDEEEVREQTYSFLSKFVNSIILASDGLEGLEVFKKYHEDDTLVNLDLIITDISMPRMNGLQMLSAINKINHLIPSIITTAYNDSVFLQEAINQKVRGYINKPLNMSGLVESVIMVSEPKYLRDKLEQLNKKLKSKIEQTTYTLKSILDAQDNLILVISNDEFFDANQTFLDFFGCKNYKEFKSKYDCVSNLFIKKDNYFSTENSTIWFNEIIKLEDNKRVVIIKDLHNEEIIFRVNMRSFMFNTKHIVISFTDITDLKHYTYELQYKATHDNLTKLFNRQKFNDELSKEIKRECRYEHGLSLLMLDIDDFKKVNDTHGHDIGDIVLKDISKIIQETIRITDYAARWGGEEFMVLLPETALEEAERIAELLRKNIEKYKNKIVNEIITVSIGVTHFQIKEDTLDTFTKKVDLAMYQAKQTGKNKVVKYEK